MGRILYTDNIGFPMADWERESIRKVFAGTDCIMAITEDGRVLQKITSKEAAARTKFWTRITQISISKCCTGVAIGLVSDGTCMIAKRPIRSACEESRQNFDELNEKVKSWHDIVQVAASDSLFALDASGNVHYAYYSHRRQYVDDYMEVTSWRGISRIATGTQNSVFGVTREGKILCAGGNCYSGPHGYLHEKLGTVTDAVDIYPSGSECECIVILKKDGTLTDERGIRYTPWKGNDDPGNTEDNEEDMRHIVKMPEGPTDQVLEGTFYNTVVARTKQESLFSVLKMTYQDWETDPIFSGKYRIRSFALGDHNYGRPFLIAVAED